MSGHSHWSGIKHKKGLADAKRSKVFSKFAQEITLAAKEGGGDPSFNAKLRTVIDKAKAMNMPADNIERAIRRGAGGGEADTMQELFLEAYGPGGIAIVVHCITDKHTRTIGEVRNIVNQHGGKFVEGGAVRWMFEQKGVIELELQKQTALKEKDGLELAAIEAGAQDIAWQDGNILTVYTSPTELDRVKTWLEQKNIAVSSSGLELMAKESVETCRKYTLT
ncbi:MAG: YebC/PmpR family DNA-binding transcriptional regulator [Candidatus Wildermuthbacteria bacterium]|nr:YebC/PmpR family DNA-binding transcriptional regulator [Candidatus Wildermuthbacteria bacterium]